MPYLWCLYMGGWLFALWIWSGEGTHSSHTCSAYNCHWHFCCLHHNPLWHLYCFRFYFMGKTRMWEIDCLGFLTKRVPPFRFCGAEDPTKDLAHAGQSTQLPTPSPGLVWDKVSLDNPGELQIFQLPTLASWVLRTWQACSTTPPQKGFPEKFNVNRTWFVTQICSG